jgi:hypothetical protein
MAPAFRGQAPERRSSSQSFVYRDEGPLHFTEALPDQL